MEHKDFPIPGFEHMNNLATDEDKQIIIFLAKQIGKPINPNGPWPEPFSRWDAINMMWALQEQNPSELKHVSPSSNPPI